MPWLTSSTRESNAMGSGQLAAKDDSRAGRDHRLATRTNRAERPVDCCFATGDNDAYPTGAGDRRPIEERQLRWPHAIFGSLLPTTEERAEEKEQETWMTFLKVMTSELHSVQANEWLKLSYSTGTS